MSVEKWMPIMYATYYGDMKQIAKDHGYALAIHGSLTRDFDLILIPWVDNPRPHIEVLKYFKQLLSFECSDDILYNSKVEKPHGRVAYVIHTGGGGYVDISVVNGIE